MAARAFRCMASSSASPRPTGSPARSASTWWRRAGGRRVDNYLGRVTKPRILEAVREAKGDQAAQLIDHLKKGEMAKEAERLLDGTGWLPEPLRLADSAPSSDPPASAVETLPAFLTDGEDAQSRQAAE